MNTENNTNAVAEIVVTLKSKLQTLLVFSHADTRLITKAYCFVALNRDKLKKLSKAIHKRGEFKIKLANVFVHANSGVIFSTQDFQIEDEQELYLLAAMLEYYWSFIRDTQAEDERVVRCVSDLLTEIRSVHATLLQQQEEMG
jgi:hypothetical protein